MFYLLSVVRARVSTYAYVLHVLRCQGGDGVREMGNEIERERGESSRGRTTLLGDRVERGSLDVGLSYTILLPVVKLVCSQFALCVRFMQGTRISCRVPSSMFRG